MGDSTMRSIPTFENTAKGYSDLYTTVLVDTPVGPYFSKFLQESAVHRGSSSRNVRADTNAINITLNSFGTPLNDPVMRISDRKRLYPSVGHMYPVGTAMLADVSSEEELGRVLELFPAYLGIWNIHSTGNDKSIDDAFYERDVQQLELAFEGQMHFGVFYAYVKLKEQEIRNLVWITECVLQQQKDEIEKFVPVFSFHAPWRASKKR